MPTYVFKEHVKRGNGRNQRRPDPIIWSATRVMLNDEMAREYLDYRRELIERAGDYRHCYVTMRKL